MLTLKCFKAVLDAQEGQNATFFAPLHLSKEWTQINERMYYVIKAESHNHPSAISPFPGAATGAGGEIRDEGAVGRGSRPKAGLTGFNVSSLLIPGFYQPWELEGVSKPGHIASGLDIMLEGTSIYDTLKFATNHNRSDRQCHFQ